MVKFLDLKAAADEIREELDAAYCRFMESGWYVLGSEVEAFEGEYATYCAAPHCVGVGTGLDALQLALRALDVGVGDEVIVPSNTYIATWLAVTMVGAKLVPVEPDPKTHNITPEVIDAALTTNTKVVLPVNLYGHPVDYDSIISIAKSHGASVVVDNAQAHGAKYHGRPVGGIADVECHSFYPSKNLGAYGEAGAITTKNREIAERVKILRNYGSKKRYHNNVCGTNSRIDALQSAFLRVKLRHLDEWNLRREQLASDYINELSKVQGVTLPTVSSYASPVWHLFVIRHQCRDDLQEHLSRNDIQTLVHYPIPPHLSEAYAGLGFSASSFPIASKLASEVLSIPLYPQMSSADARSVIESIRSFRR